MIAPTFAQKHYHSAHARFLITLLCALFQRELPRLGPVLSQRLAEEVLHLFDAICPALTHLEPGQMLWNVIDKTTRANSPKRRFIPAVLTLIDPEDISALEKGTSPNEVFEKVLARLFYQAYEQGGLLSTRDAALIFCRPISKISTVRQKYEKENDCVLPHPGSLQDMGSTISHKSLAVRKVIHEGKDPAEVASEINHSQKAVDRYLTDYQRVKTLYDLKPDIEFIHLATNIAKHVIRQYINLIPKENPNENTTEK